MARSFDAQLWSLQTAYDTLLGQHRPLSGRGGAETAQPVSIRQLRDNGASDNSLLLMLYHAHVEHYHVRKRGAKPPPAPRKVESAVIEEFSAFSLSEAGVGFAGQAATDKGFGFADELFWHSLRLLERKGLIPSYKNREFKWGRNVLKVLKQPAPNQELILQTAEELGWPAWFDDPLPHQAGINPKQRVHDTAESLNRWQRIYLVHFRAVRNGTGFGWELW